MAYDTLLDPPQLFQPREVQGTPFARQPVPELKRKELSGNVAAWAEYLKLTQNEIVTTHEVFHIHQDGLDDVVAWVRRTGATELNGQSEKYDYSQLVCNHSAEIDDGVEFDEALMACSAVMVALEKRAYLIRERLQNRQLLDQHKKESLLVGKSAKSIVKDLAAYVIKREQLYPHTWYANFMSGNHTVTGLSSIFEMEPKHMKSVARSMADDGLVELYGDEIITLKQAA